MGEDTPSPPAPWLLRGQLRNGAEVTLQCVAEDIRATELVGRCGRQLFWLGFCCSERIRANSREKCKDFKELRCLPPAEPLGSKLPAAGRRSWESTAVSCLVRVPVPGAHSRALLLGVLPLGGALMSPRNLKTVLRRLGLRNQQL